MYRSFLLEWKSTKQGTLGPDNILEIDFTSPTASKLTEPEIVNWSADMLSNRSASAKLLYETVETP